MPKWLKRQRYNSLTGQQTEEAQFCSNSSWPRCSKHLKIVEKVQKVPWIKTNRKELCRNTKRQDRLLRVELNRELKLSLVLKNLTLSMEVPVGMESNKLATWSQNWLEMEWLVEVIWWNSTNLNLRNKRLKLKIPSKIWPEKEKTLLSLARKILTHSHRLVAGLKSLQLKDLVNQEIPRDKFKLRVHREIDRQIRIKAWERINQAASAVAVVF